jgi:hypothetical protein
MGNWNGHLTEIRHMLPYFAAAGHNLYLKSSYIYLQQMSEITETKPDVHRAFSVGNHVIRRSDRYWAGLSTDLIIEQVLMRSVKSVGGMTRGRGMSESQRAQWLLSMPACADMNNAIQEFTGNKFETNEQHKESSEARVVRDNADIHTLSEFLHERNPFSDEHSLRNIETGAVADANVNVDKAKLIGQTILNEMENQNVSEYTFKRTNQAVTLGTKNSLKINGEEIHIDPQLLFQRLVIVSDSSLENIEEIFEF